MSRRFLLACFLCALGSLGGCSDKEPKPVAVSGAVNLDSKPLESGTVTLFGDAGAVPESFPVKGGKFEGKAKPGKKRVEIRAFRSDKTPKMGDMEIEGASGENYLPERFNTRSTLTAEVSADGINPSKFEVQSK
jgi:hypothetical protein